MVGGIYYLSLSSLALFPVFCPVSMERTAGAAVLWERAAVCWVSGRLGGGVGFGSSLGRRCAVRPPLPPRHLQLTRSEGNPGMTSDSRPRRSLLPGRPGRRGASVAWLSSLLGPSASLLPRERAQQAHAASPPVDGPRQCMVPARSGAVPVISNSARCHL